MDMANTERAVTRVIVAQQQREGAGFLVRRPFPSAGLESADPFLLLDEMGPADYAPGEAVGAPDHPHRGFETVTYMLDGEFEHEDSTGRKGTLRAGDVQWMTAGAGVVHSEMPSARIREEGGRVHGFQLWVNLPKRDKLIAPRYQEIPGAGIPEATSADGKAQVRVVAGEALGARAVIDTRTPILYQHWTLRPGAAVLQPVPPGYSAVAYVFDGEARIGPGGETVGAGQLAVFGPGGTAPSGASGTAPSGASGAVRLATDTAHSAQLLLLGGVPLGEPVAWYGPFVMNTEQEVRQAIEDYQSGRMGAIAR
jgi:redox-sensitive bicupin YhaK (pirin superfamily)